MGSTRPGVVCFEAAAGPAVPQAANDTIEFGVESMLRPPANILLVTVEALGAQSNGHRPAMTVSRPVIGNNAMPSTCLAAKISLGTVLFR